MQADKKQVIRLLNTARGQMDGIIKMVQEDRYCLDISNQIMASQAILSRTNKEILKAHLFNCVINSEGTMSEEKVNELNTLLEKLL
ncbi:MAG: metal-sensing transcriptional repressor [Corallococcus sp.]|nr:metal-sensing transcriptional repressor [Corallococcus sp.]MCM1359839.1 metal-sensing transcriptional repressor [Corallococcus sp.]MCM1395273.1 metal-sensing transcriptional repressor [Corallococcus sp.]